MGCFACFSSGQSKVSRQYSSSKGRTQPSAARSRHRESPQQQHSLSRPQPQQHHHPQPHQNPQPPNRPESTRNASGGSSHNKKLEDEEGEGDNKNIAAQTFTFRELATATKNFRQECLIGEGGFGRVYKGRIDRTSQNVAVKQLDRNGLQGNREFLVEVLMLSLLHHQNLVNLIGYCADGEQRLLVYEYMALGSLEDHLLDLPPNKPALDWSKRMKIALDAANGLEYLHCTANPPVIYRDLKSSNILLDSEYNAKLSDFGLAKLGPVGDNTHVSSRIMGTYGYCAPEYQMTGQLTVKSDIYSFGVVLLELITGRRAIDNTRSANEQTLVSWASPIFNQTSRFPELADPLLEGKYSKKSLNQAVGVAAMCLNNDHTVRPLISDVVTALSFLWIGPESQTTSSNQSLKPSINATEDQHRTDASNSARERKQAVAEAMEWGSNSRNHMQKSQPSLI